MSAPRPGWLPEIVSVDGEWGHVLASLYSVFVADFKQTRRMFEHRPVWWDRRHCQGKYMRLKLLSGELKGELFGKKFNIVPVQTFPAVKPK